MKMRTMAMAVFGISLSLLVGGCGVWDAITDTGTDEVMLKGEKGTSCSLDSECRSDSCVYPGICE